MKQDNDPCGHDVLFSAHTHACVFSIRGLGSGISVPRWFKSRCSICSVGPSDDRVQGVVEPLHGQLDHLSQGVVLRALLLAAHRLMGRRGSRWERNDKHTSLCFLARPAESFSPSSPSRCGPSSHLQSQRRFYRR